ncbi:MAG TPA: SIS domain-containing protein [Anaerolineales bacterium]
MDNLKNNPYVQDVISQGKAVQAALAQFDPSPLRDLAESIQAGRFDRILLTGMGGSFFASYPALLILANAGLPAMLVDSAELIHHCRGMVTARTLVWATSQSGRSAEIVSVLALARQAGATLLATVNDLDSPLAGAAQGAVIPIHAEVEKTVSTRTYTNTLAVSQLAALGFVNENLEHAMEDLRLTASSMEDYLGDWEKRLKVIQERIPPPRKLILLGRGPSLASANAGALILGEAAKFAAIGMQAGEFRHGPLELAAPDLTILLFAGPAGTRELNRRLYEELKETGSHAVWVTSSNEAETPTSISMPHAEGIGLPLVEILPIQLLSMHIALSNNVEPGKFFRVGKVTLRE